MRNADNVVAPTQVVDQFRSVSGKVVEGGGGATLRQARALAGESARLSGYRLYDLVDEVRVTTGNPFFRLENGRRIIGLSDSTLLSPHRSMRLLEGMHEIAHAEAYALRGFIPARGTAAAAKAELVSERLAIMRLKQNYGNLAEETLQNSANYMREWRTTWRLLKH